MKKVSSFIMEKGEIVSRISQQTEKPFVTPRTIILFTSHPSLCKEAGLKTENLLLSLIIEHSTFQSQSISKTLFPKPNTYVNVISSAVPKIG